MVVYIIPMVGRVEFWYTTEHEKGDEGAGGDVWRGTVGGGRAGACLSGGGALMAAGGDAAPDSRAVPRGSAKGELREAARVAGCELVGGRGPAGAGDICVAQGAGQ